MKEIITIGLDLAKQVFQVPRSGCRGLAHVQPEAAAQRSSAFL
jgi:hypothetical protein